MYKEQQSPLGGMVFITKVTGSGVQSTQTEGQWGDLSIKEQLASLMLRNC